MKNIALKKGLKTAVFTFNEEYSFEIRNEAKKEMEDMIKNYIDCKIGSDNKEVFKIERKRILSKLKKDVEFRMKYRYR